MEGKEGEDEFQTVEEEQEEEEVEDEAERALAAKEEARRLWMEKKCM